MQVSDNLHPQRSYKIYYFGDPNNYQHSLNLRYTNILCFCSGHTQVWLCVGIVYVCVCV